MHTEMEVHGCMGGRVVEGAGIENCLHVRFRKIYIYGRAIIHNADAKNLHRQVSVIPLQYTCMLYAKGKGGGATKLSHNYKRRESACPQLCLRPHIIQKNPYIRHPSITV